MSERRRLVRNTLAYSVVQVAQMLSAFVFMPFLIRQFGLADYGVYLLASAVSGYLGLLDFGVGTTVMKFVAEYRATRSSDELGELISNVLLFYVVVGLVAATFLGLFSQFGVGIFKLTADGAHLASNLFLLSALIALFSWPATIGGFVIVGLQEYGLVSKIGVCIVAAGVLATALVLVSGRGPLALLAANGVVGIVGGLAYFLFALRRMPGVRVSLARASLPVLRKVFAFSWVIFVSQVCSLIVFQQTDRIVLGVFVGAAAVGLYEAASKIQALVQQLSNMSASALMPAASQYDAQGRPEALRALFLRGTKYTVAFITPIVVTLIVLARQLLLTWLGPVMASQAFAAQLFVSHWLVYANLIVAYTMITGMGRVRSIMWFTIIQAAANLALSLTLVHSLRVTGVILGTVATNIAIAPFVLVYTVRLLGLPVSRWFRDIVVPVYPYLVVPVVVGLAANAIGLTNSLLGVAVAGSLCVSAYWGALYAFGLSTAERHDARALASAALARIGIKHA